MAFTEAYRRQVAGTAGRQQQNLDTLSKPKRAALIAELERVLGH